ncbi:protein pxr1-like [Limosa lapponica baueri]|uniref:Protein pxr1-like n=1 Tax=Limosa lapponica baueri TaxID=1758121 RepID=A0A2I0UTJ7_LIMLA|nr:protein pxr1-like [Limosa lapponica baueri]
MPALSKMDPPLAKAEPINDSSSVIKYLTRGKKCNSSHKREVRLCERNNSADTKINKRRRRDAPGGRAENPLQPMVKTMQAVPLQPMELHSGADIHLQLVEDPILKKVDVL